MVIWIILIHLVILLVLDKSQQIDGKYFAHIGDGQQAILKRKDGKILKLIQPPPRGPREVNFYQEINSSNHPNDALIRNHIPKYHGLERVEFHNGIDVAKDFLVLDDITEGFQLPTVMDIKIGKQTWGPDASEDKKLSESSKYCGTKGPFGFRLVWQPVSFVF